MKGKVTISRSAQEALWGFAKMGLTISQHYQCDLCKKWLVLTTIPNKRLRAK
jgi:hypothetical protein